MPKEHEITDECKIIKFNKENPDEQEVVATNIKGKAAAIKKLHQFRNQETDREKYGYLWQFMKK